MSKEIRSRYSWADSEHLPLSIPIIHDPKERGTWDTAAANITNIHRAVQRAGSSLFPEVAKKRVVSLFLVQDSYDRIRRDFTDGDSALLRGGLPPDFWLHRYLSAAWRNKHTDHLMTIAPEIIADTVLHATDVPSDDVPALVAAELTRRGMDMHNALTLLGFTLATPAPSDRINTYLEPDRTADGRRIYALRWSGKAFEGIARIREIRDEVHRTRAGRNNVKIMKYPVRITSWLITSPRHLKTIIGVDSHEIVQNGGSYYPDVRIRDLLTPSATSDEIMKLTPFPELLRISAHNTVLSQPGMEQFIRTGEMQPLGVALIQPALFFRRS